MTSAILLSGGTGQRMGASAPKQYLLLDGKPLVLHALETLLTYPNWQEIAIVCDPIYQDYFRPYEQTIPFRFALPGKSRQESVLSGLLVLSKTDLVCIHDGARPLLSQTDLQKIIEAGKLFGAAALATPVTSTIKEVDSHLNVKKTVDRSCLWQMQTPQILRYELLKQGLQTAIAQNLTLTDDVALAELLGYPVKLVLGQEDNIKITTPFDLALAKLLFTKRTQDGKVQNDSRL